MLPASSPLRTILFRACVPIEKRIAYLLRLWGIPALMRVLHRYWLWVSKGNTQLFSFVAFIIDTLSEERYTYN